MKKQYAKSSSVSAKNSDLERAAIRAALEGDHLLFSRYFFKAREGIKFRINWHHVLISDAVERVIRGESKNVIINVSPGSSKTELVVINLIARGLALNPRARFLHISYSDDLALLNSQKAREIVQSDEFQELWPLEIADDAKAKKRWNVSVDGKTGGGVYAVSLGGQITGFRAGHMAEGFQGAIIIDDPLKVKGATSKVQRDEANKTLVNTVKSRKANPDTPIVVIMQRLAEDDPTGFIRGGGFPGEWEFIEIPALVDDAYVAALPPHVRELVEIGDRADDGKFSYWPYKEPLEDLLAMRDAKDSATRYVFAGQYMQRPTPEGGDLLKGEWFGRYRALPKMRYRMIYADTAQKTKEHNDFSVFECWGLGEDGRVYLLDLVRGKWEAPELERRAIDFWNKHKPTDAFRTTGSLRKLKVEDKSSGTGLIQSIRKKGSIPVEGIERHTDKLVRVKDVAGYIESGLVMIPEEAPWVSEFIAECEAFTPDDTHAHDDQIDPMCDAINDMLAKGGSIYDSI